MAMIESTSNTKMIAAISGVDLVNRKCSAVNALAGEVAVHLNVLPSGNFVIPSLGEQWIIERTSDSWFLCDRLDFQDARVNLPWEEGLTALGGVGPTYLVGSRVILPSAAYFGDGQIRLLGGVLQTRPDDQSAWVTVGAGGGGVTTGTAPHKVSYIQTLTTRAVGYGQMPDGIRPGPCTFTRAIYTFGTQDQSGSSTVEMRGNSGAALAGSSLTVSAANQAQGDATKAARTVTGSWVFAEDDIFSAYTSAVGTTPGDRLTVHLTGTVNLTLS